MAFFKALFRGLLNSVKRFINNLRHPPSNLADAGYDLGQDIGQKVLYVIMMSVAFFLPSDIALAWFLVSSIFGFFFVVTPFESIFEKRSKALLEKENPKRFLRMSQFVWQLIVFVSLAAFFIADLVNNFSMTSLVGSPFVFLICYGLLTKNATVVVKPSDPNKVGSKAWKEANGVMPVPGVEGQWMVYRDKYGNYYENRLGTFVAIPTPVDINKRK